MMRPMDPHQVLQDSRQMLEEMLFWYGELKSLELSSLIPDKDTADRTAVFSADMIVGFCKSGALASARVDSISAPIADLFRRMHKRGIEQFVLLQEWHDEHAKEFDVFPPHGIAETEEAEAIPELQKLPFFHKFVVFRKNTLTPAFSRKEEFVAGHIRTLGESFDRYLNTHDIDTAVVVGNCTDLCMRELAMYLRMWANQHQKDLRVVIPENCVETFDMSFDVARELGAMPHPGDLYHLWALYEMARNNIDIVKKIV